MEPIVEYLGEKDFMLGSEPKLIDFYMLEACEFVEWVSENSFYRSN